MTLETPLDPLDMPPAPVPVPVPELTIEKRRRRLRPPSSPSPSTVRATARRSGTPLRRILLSSLEGAAITSVRIDQVQHEFSTIEGMQEDSTEFLLNVKEIRLKALSNRPRHAHPSTPRAPARSPPATSRFPPTSRS